jgi:hypothetical protein
MKSFHFRVLSALVLLSAGWLHATPVDPFIKFNTGGGGSTDITCTTNGCLTTLSPTINAAGEANLDIFNASGKDITGLIFYIPTLNFNQEFNASTNAFTTAAIFADEVDQQLLVEFFGVGSGTGGTAFLGPDPGAPGGGTVPEPCVSPVAPNTPGFTPCGTVVVQSFFGTVPEGSTLAGFLNGQEAVLTLAVPEPSMLGLAFSGFLGLFLVRRRLIARKANI